MVYIKTYIFNHFYRQYFGPVNCGPPQWPVSFFGGEEARIMYVSLLNLHNVEGTGASKALFWAAYS